MPMQKGLEVAIFLISVQLLTMTFLGCKGGVDKLVVGDINGPDILDERTFAEYSITASGPGLTYLWSVKPHNAGEFYPPDAATTRFTANDVDVDTPIEIWVLVKSAYEGPVVKSFKLTVHATPDELWAGEIEGPDSIPENSSATYRISAGGVEGITYLWKSLAPELGWFETSTSAEPELTVGEVPYNTPIEIKVYVDADYLQPIWRIKSITILAEEKYFVNGIIGPVTICEHVPATFSVDAYSDKDLSYQWSCDPPEAGIFDSPSSAVTKFTPEFVPKPENAVIHARVESEGYEPSDRKFGINIEDEYAWVRTVGEGKGCAVDMDSKGDIYLTGYTSEYGCEELFLIKMDPLGNTVWTRSIAHVEGSGSYYEGHSECIAIDSMDNIYISGWFMGTYDFDPGPGEDIRDTHIVDYHWADCLFLCRFDPNGNLQLAITWAPFDYYHEVAHSRGIALDNAGNIYITGRFKGEFDFDPGPDQYILQSHWEWEPHFFDYDYDIFLLKLDSNGNFLWTAYWGRGGDDHEEGVSVEVGLNNNVYVAGSFYGKVDFDPGPEFYYLEAVYYWDGFLSMFNPDGDFQWARGTAEGEGDLGRDIVIDQNGDILFASSYKHYHTGSWAYLKKYDASGGLLWTYEYSKDNYLSIASLAVDALGNAYVVGHWWDFDWRDSFFLIRIGNSGTLLNELFFGGAKYTGGHDYIKDIALGNSGDVYFAGYIEGYADLDPHLPEPYNYFAENDYDAFLSKIVPGELW
jgi:hypothetical protein